MEENLKFVGKMILLVIGVLLLLALGYGCQQTIDSREYNNGVCTCGGHFHYEQAVGHRFTTDYIYACDKCGRRIELCYMPSEEDNVEDDIVDDNIEEE